MNNDARISEVGTSAEPSMASLVSGIIADAQVLLKQQFALLRRELQQELRQARTAAISLGVGVAILAVGAMLLIVMLVHLLQVSTQLPLWGCYGIVGGLLALIGGGFLAFARSEAADVELAPPPQTAEAIKENVEWLKHPATPATK